jgi:hypothetical protein
VALTDITITWQDDMIIGGDDLGRVLGYLYEECQGPWDQLWDASHNAIMLEGLGDLLCEMVNHGIEHAAGQHAIGEQIIALSRRIAAEPFKGAMVTVAEKGGAA